MPVTYSLPSDWTNDSLKEAHPEIYSNLYAVSISTVVVGVPTIDAEWLKRMVELVDAGNGLLSHRMFPSSERTFWMNVYNVLAGMKTNAAKRTRKNHLEFNVSKS